MAVAHDAVSESHTGTTGVASVASFSWSHVPGGTPRSALVCTLAKGANPITSVTYGGVSMTAMPYTAYDSDTEPGFLQVWFLDNISSGTQTVVVNRTNDAVITYAVCVTQTALGATEIYEAGVQTRAGSAAQQTAASSSSTGVASSWQTLTGVTDGSPGTGSVRYMFVHSGASGVPTAGTNVTSLSSPGYIDFGVSVFQSFRDTSSPQQGAVDMSVGVAISDDLAVIGLAVRESTGSTVTGAASLTAEATLGAVGSVTLSGAAALSAAATLAAAGGLTILGASSLSGDATLAAAGDILISGGTVTAVASLSALASLAATGGLVLGAAATLDGTATVGATGSVVRGASASLTGNADVAAAAGLILGAIASFAGDATVGAVGRITLGGVATLDGTATLSPSASMTYLSGASLTANADLTAVGSTNSDPPSGPPGVGTMLLLKIGR